MNCLAKLGLAGLFAFGLAQAKVNFPFPQMSDYGGNATLLSDKAKASEELKSQFAYWLKTMYNEEGDVAGVRSNPGSNEYFSEGVGYGMLLMVYFSDNTTSYQSQFDKIWNFYKKMMNENGLMVWKVGNLNQAYDKGAALDGDIDAAAALVMAYYQFGDEKYKEDAKKLIQSMKKFEFESNGLHLPGDKWGDAGYNRKNPGYFDPAYMPLFALVDTENADFWNKTAYDANMKLYEASSAEVTTGLIDDWTDKNGKSEDDQYSYDASRAPWRNAKAVCWHGDKRALALDKKMAEFVSTVSASRMSGPVNRSSGGLGSDHNSTFVTSLMTALISDAKYQSKLDEYWKEAVALGDENYFNQSLKLLNGLLVSGNMPNLAAATPAGPVSSSSVPASSSSVESSSSNGTIALPTAVTNAPKMTLSGRTLQLETDGKVHVDLISVTGSVLKSFDKDARGTVAISLNGVPSGLYVVRVKNANSAVLKKIKLD
ncbi:glycosyl hydrolase family 8 [Fibrobacter sp. UWB12]|uniref:glycosyl hydrolase family 8 n=1 Tax=Fibrobacter sp. UWB12 TaxID=1896203 RepID=UPI0009235CC4|nr:glycosyl hydrolase family 8 [Fibrobacter sp. UWB12]SHK27472.1 Por secretion system C-terminal sorting domain-containing protein [Fibrobacter sp. UWB12]